MRASILVPSSPSSTDSPAPGASELAPPATVANPIRRRRWVVLLAAALAALLLASCTPDARQQEALDLIHQTRREQRVRELAWHSQLGDKAQAWAERLAREGRLYHSNLRDGAPAGWRMLGENVGVGSSIKSVHEAYKRSPAHMDNLKNPSWTHVGTGVARGSDGRVYTVQVFMQA